MITLIPTLLTLAFLALGVSASYEAKWEVFKQNHNRHYSVGEEMMRKGIYMTNLKLIEQHNELFVQGRSSYYLGENHLTDMTNLEVTNTIKGYRSNPARKSVVDNVDDDHISVDDLPKSVDWRKQGYVTPVKNQSTCNSGWAFSTTGALEGQYFKATGKLVSLSESDLVDCSKLLGNCGCLGGDMLQSFKYVMRSGIATEDSYPYKPDDTGSCRHDQSTIGTTEKGYIEIKPSGSEKALQAAVAKHGPISVAIDASSVFFKLYKGGVYGVLCSTLGLDHAVLVVGYDTTADGTDYWIVKNSWGKDWGEQGYIRMVRNWNNMCGIATSAVVPII